MRRHIVLYFYFVLHQIKALVEYPLDLIIGVLGALIGQGIPLLMLWFIVDQAEQIAGYRFAELLLLQGMASTAKAINLTVAQNIWTLGYSFVQGGHFDRYLIRPVSPLFNLLADKINPELLGHVVIGVGMIVVSVDLLGLGCSPGRVLALIIGVLCASIVLFSVMLFSASLVFIIDDPLPIMRAASDTYQFTLYPADIFARPVVWALTWVIPYCLAIYHPARYFVGREGGEMVLLAVPASAAFFAAALCFWRFSLTRYTSSGG